MVEHDDMVDAFIYGLGIEKFIYRKWWNPLRWILGPVKVKRIKPWKIWK